jgi:predicted ATP-grasp superfamily ATP-dependent carboligase
MERVVGGENATNIDVENMDSQETEDIDELQVFKEIRKETGISPVHFGYMPKKMYLKEYEINSEQGRAVLLYDYNGQTIRYTMYMNDADSSHGRTDTDKLINEYTIEVENGVQVTIEEYEVVNKENRRFVAEFEYQNAQYQLMGLMEKDEFEKIINNFGFYK